MSLKRVLEPEVMDTPEEAHNYNDMDHSTVNELFVSELLQFANEHSFELEDILDMGTGTALIPIEFCKQSESGRIMAIDMAVNMLELANYNLEAEGLIERVQLSRVDAKAMPFDDNMFDCVMSNSIIHHIPEPLLCLQEAARVTCDGGVLFFRDLMRPESDEQVKKIIQAYTGNENEHSQKMFDDSLRAALSLDEIREFVEEIGFDPESVQATSDRHWTWAALKPKNS